MCRSQLVQRAGSPQHCEIKNYYGNDDIFFIIIISHFSCMCGIILQTNLVSRMINIRSNKKWKKKSQNVLGTAAENWTCDPHMYSNAA